MAYNYIVGQENTALEDAPAVVKNALGRMTWAGRHHANGAKFVDYNEVLALGYFEGGKIGVSVSLFTVDSPTFFAFGSWHTLICTGMLLRRDRVLLLTPTICF